MISGQDRRPEIARGMFVENLKSIGRYKPWKKYSWPNNK